MTDSEVRLIVSGLVYNQSVIGTYGLILSNEERTKKFSVMIGEPEAQSIALKINNRAAPRPLTHDLLLNILNTFNTQLIKVLIYDMVSDIFYSELHIKKDDEVFVIDARTSDAVALAVRAECPIYIKTKIFELVAVLVSAEDENVENTRITEVDADNFDNLSLEELEEILKSALENEKYEIAVKIRDAINRKK